MNKILSVLIGIFIISGLTSQAAFAITRNDRKVTAETTLQGGYEILGNGSVKVTTAGTRVQLSGTDTPVAWATVCSSRDNAGVFAVGGSSVVAAGSGRSGITLNADDCITLRPDNLTQVYVDSTSSGDWANYVYQEFV